MTQSSFGPDVSVYNARYSMGTYWESGSVVKNRVLKKVAIASAAVLCILACVAAVSLLMLQMRTDALHDDYRDMLSNPEYSALVQAEGIQVISEDASCGYAVIEMFSSWDDGNVTEESLYDEYGKVVTSTGQSFCNEIREGARGGELMPRRGIVV